MYSTSWAVIVGLGPGNAVQAATEDLAGSFFVNAERYLGVVFIDLTSMLLVTSTFAAHLAIQYVNTRYIYSLAKDRILPGGLGVTHPRHGSPYRASVITSAVMFVGVTVVILCGLTAEEIYARFAGGGLLIPFLSTLDDPRGARQSGRRSARRAGQLAGAPMTDRSGKDGDPPTHTRHRRRHTSTKVREIHLVLAVRTATALH